MTHKNPTQRTPRARVIDLGEARRLRGKFDKLAHLEVIAHLPSKQRIAYAVALNRFYQQLKRELGR